jgi:hypothetical protein
MPRGDRTGPGGLGPMTGRMAGYCAGFNRPGFTGFGRAYGNAFNRRPFLRWRRRFGSDAREGDLGFPGWEPYPMGVSESAEMGEKRYLKDQVVFLERRLRDIKKRLDQLGEPDAAEQ